MQNRSLPASFRDHSRRMVTANVVHRAQNVVIAAHNDYGSPAMVVVDELARFLQLFRPAHQLPCIAEDRLRFQVGDARVYIPGRRNGGSFGERSLIVVERKNVFHGWHAVVSAARANRSFQHVRETA